MAVSSTKRRKARAIKRQTKRTTRKVGRSKR